MTTTEAATTWRHWILTADGYQRPAYALVQEGDSRQPVELIERTDDGGGAINAVDLAARMSLRGGPVTVQLPNGEPLARFIGGAREGRTRPLRAPVKAVD